MLFWAEYILNLLIVLKYVLIAATIFIVIPSMALLARDEFRARTTAPDDPYSPRHRPNEFSNNLAATFLAQRKRRGTHEYKLRHPAVAGKRA